MALVKKHSLPTYHLCFILLSTFSLASISAPASNPALCVIPSPAPKRIPAAGKDALSLLQLFQLTAGYFVGGEELHFAQEEGDDWSYVVPRSFSILPHSVERTEGDSGLVHVAATLTLSGGRTRLLLLRGAGRRRHQSYQSSHTVSFYLDGYYSNSTSGELCMTGAGTYAEDEDGTIQNLPGVVLKLRLRNPPSLTDPFITGSLLGDGFKAISLVAYAESDSYRYGKPASCASLPRPPSSSHARNRFHALGGANFSCARLRERLVSSFKLRYGGDVNAPSASPALSWVHEQPRMHVGKVQCTTDGAVRAYMFFTNNTETRRGRLARRTSFTVTEDAVVAEGRWDSGRNMLCFRACRVVPSAVKTSLAVQQECGIGMSFWFPGVWTVHHRSAVAGTIWNTSQAVGTAAVGAISASSIDTDVHRSNFSDVKYSYDDTVVAKAKEQYLASELSNCDKKTNKGSFISANYTYHDFEFQFHDSDA
ncbi:hypothetical protein PR202_ga10147 [Eleusine coracana subsp. coracana]|uniref:DUF2921 domain-containing protein n=1 Tax=Eleusine coracana subsp. coracana TaxID=191504 RepID=A0AAV5C5Y5_ELECO|nr:hypothetical protein PR202_ga10147 [Eleusine coracana subsp. coracana]